MKIIVTGGLGFIGSNIVRHLNTRGMKDIIISDNYENDKHKGILTSLKIKELVGPYELLDRDLRDYFIIHMGACSNTSDAYCDEHQNDYNYNKLLIGKKCKGIIYASSAAVYGNDGYPLNSYGLFKKLTDDYAKGTNTIGLRFFNVYGYDEDNKKEMASMPFKIMSDNNIKIFKDGNQSRDFINVFDIYKIVTYLMLNFNKVEKGTYDIGTGKSVTFNQLFKAITKKKPKYKEMSKDIMKYFQTNTIADLTKLRRNGYSKPIETIEGYFG